MSLLHSDHSASNREYKTLIKAISKHTLHSGTVDYTTTSSLHKNVRPRVLYSISKYKSFFSHFTTSGCRPCKGLLVINIKKYQVRSCFKVPRPLFIVKYHNLSPALLKPVALREYKNIQSGRIPSALYSGKCTKRLEEVAPCGHYILPDKQERENTRVGTGFQSVWSLGIQDDTGAVLLFSALEGGMSLLQIFYHRQQPSGDALTRLHELNVAFGAI